MGHVKCAICGSKIEESYLKRHLRRNHRDVLPLARNRLNITCCLCQEKFSFRNDFRHHVDTNHKKIVDSFFVLESWEEFLEWLKAEENTIKIHYVKRRSAITLSNGNSRLNYFCQYDNNKDFKTIPNDKRRRALKHQGSYKISGCCPAEIIVEKYTDGRIGIKYFSTHIGHDSSKAHFFLRPDDKTQLADKIKAGIPFTKILNEIEDDTSKDPKKVLHITRKTLHNIASNWKIKSWKRDADDAANVSEWVENMKLSNYNPVCLFKMQGEQHAVLQENDFVLVLVTKMQAKLLQEFGNQVVCIDSFHGKNVYEFFLTTILLMDDNEEVLPGAYLMSNRTDATVMEIFFREIYSKINTSLSPVVFMSDEVSSYYDSWIQVMNPDTLPAKLLCPWLVEKNWRESLNKIGKGNRAHRLAGKKEEIKDKQLTVYQSLQSLLREKDKTVFQEKLNSLTFELISTPITKYFGEYFKKKYAHNIDLWANCFRNEIELNRNTKFEDFHQLMESVYNDGMKTKRLDTCIDALLQVAKDQERCKDILEKELSSPVSKSNLINRNEKTIHESNVAQNDSTYYIESDTDGKISYKIEKIYEVCPYACDTNGQDGCIHLYQCSCTEFLIHDVICEHLSKLSNSCKSKEATISVSFPDSTVIVYNENDDTINVICEYDDVQEQQEQDNLLLEFNKKIQHLELEMNKKAHSSTKIKMINDLMEKAISLLNNAES